VLGKRSVVVKKRFSQDGRTAMSFVMDGMLFVLRFWLAIRVSGCCVPLLLATLPAIYAPNLNLSFGFNHCSC